MVPRCLSSQPSSARMHLPVEPTRVLPAWVGSSGVTARPPEESPLMARKSIAPITGVAVMFALLATPAGAQSAATSSSSPQQASGLQGSDSQSVSHDKVESTLQRELKSTDSTDFWIHFDDTADLTAASRIEDWAERGTAVADALRRTAAESQDNVRAHLDGENVDYQAFWATNAIHIQDGDSALAEAMAQYEDVGALLPSREYDSPELEEDTAARTLDTVEWGIDAIKANDVWDQYDVRGDGIIVANIDSGVQYDHPALVNQYRGNNGDGTFDHNYHWFDAYDRCGGDAPCDHDGHGTHTMGTMVGSEDAANQIGVAPDVQWIAANGCCTSDAGLIASAQWMLEPTDIAGANPDAAQRPHIVNNSWGTQLPSVDPFLEDIVLAWEASGIMGIWSNGNLGAACRTSGSPGSRIVNYSVGAYDVDGTIAGFSSRGAGQDGEI